MNQLNLFQSPLSEETFDYGKGEVREDKVDGAKQEPFCDKIMSFLDKMNRDIGQQNKELQSMLDEIQSGWTDDEKLQINDPKEWQRRQDEKRKQEKQNTPIMPATADVIESLNKCRVEGNTLYLPPISEGALPNYNQVRQALINAGAKYKKNTFVFSSDAQPFIDRLTSGESVNIKKEFQYFPTPDDIADYLVQLAEIKDGMCVLEPSAGHGSIIEAIYRAFPRYMKGPNDSPCVTVDFFELMPENRQVLSRRCNSDESWGSRTSQMGEDFLNQTGQHRGYHRIIANPPFRKNQDIDHIYKMWSHLLPGGIIVSIASKHWQLSGNKKEKDFKEWLSQNNATIYPIERGQFKESGTMVETCIVVIEKP